jgi:hypothetical protein
VNCCVDPTAMLAGVGVTVTAVTLRVTVSVAEPWTPVRIAVTVVDPAATPVATPAAFTVATAGLEVVQLTAPVTSAVVLSLYVAVARNCCVALAAMLGAAGVTAMEVRVFVTTGACTVSDAAPEMPLMVAVMVAVPAEIAEARPAGVIPATAVSDDFHVADVVTFAVELSL